MPVSKPGGHGAIWKLAYDKGVFKWFFDHGRKGATVRQVRLVTCTLVKLFIKIKSELSGFSVYNCDIAVMLWLPQMLPSWPLLGLAYGIIRYTCIICL